MAFTNGYQFGETVTATPRGFRLRNIINAQDLKAYDTTS